MKAFDTKEKALTTATFGNHRDNFGGVSQPKQPSQANIDELNKDKYKKIFDLSLDNNHED